MRHRLFISGIGTAMVAAGCAHGPHGPQLSPEQMAAIHPEVRVVGTETTWVTRGPGVELVGRSTADLAELKPPLRREAEIFQQVFPKDSLVSVVATVRRTAPQGKPYVPAAPVPAGRATVVEVIIPDPAAQAADQSERRAPGTAPEPNGLGERNPTLPVVRAWLSAHATLLTHHVARATEADGEVQDSRVPAWAESMIPSLGEDSLLDRMTTMLAGHPETLYPLATFFTMHRPELAAPPVAQRPSEEQGGSSRGGGGMGGMGGRGGGMGGGRGGMGGGRGSRGGSSDRAPSVAPALKGAALFDAQALLVGKFLSREGYELIGALADAQIAGGTVDDVFTKRNLGTLDQVDADWKHWLTERAAVVSK